MSKQKRNKLTDPAEQNEPPTQQKHRFRNALNKANGIRYREDIKIVGARVYQFIGMICPPIYRYYRRYRCRLIWYL